MKDSIYIKGAACLSAPVPDIEAVKKVKTVIRAEELAISAAYLAMKSAGIDTKAPRHEGCGVVFGVDNAIDGVKYEFYNGVITDGALGASPLLFPYTSPNAIAAQITIAFGIRGEDVTFASGPLSFLKAVGYAFELIAQRKIERAVAGGATNASSFALFIERGPEGKKDAQAADCGPVEIVSYRETARGAAEGCEVAATMEETFGLMERALKGGGAVKAMEKDGENMVLMELSAAPPSSAPY